jgi:pyruvate/2-oxoglutarate dehydrogenase complex dihydrolipoamide dehydrogenase (E3) component
MSAGDNVIECDVCIIGAGAAGLSVAVGAAQLGARTILFEKGAMGGDCLNYGCVPSKALLAAAHAVRSITDARQFGIHAGEPHIDFAAVMEHVHGVIAQIAPHDSVERLESLGVRVIRAAAAFTGRDEVSGGGVRVRARRIVLAAGSAALIPAVPGIESVAALTNETLFALRERPEHLLVVGGGPIGVEMAQAFRRLGSAVTLIQRGRLLPRDEPELVASLSARLAAEGIVVHEDAELTAVGRSVDGIAVRFSGEREATGSHLLVATGRRARLAGLGLQNAGIAHDALGVKVDARLRTTNRRVWALGDVIGRPQFTHTAAYQAGIVVRNALFRLPAKVEYRALPWVTYCDPELAHVGLTEQEARRRHGSAVQVVRVGLADNDRARAERSALGALKVMTDRRGRILGAGLLGPHAGELIGLWGLAITRRMKLSALTGVIFPYPTLGEVSKAAASAFYAPKLFSPWPRRLVRLLLSMT